MINWKFVQKVSLCTFAAAALIATAPSEAKTKRRHQQAQEQKAEQQKQAEQKPEEAAAALPVQPATPMPGANTLNVPVPPQETISTGMPAALIASAASSTSRTECSIRATRSCISCMRACNWPACFIISRMFMVSQTLR